MPRNHKRIHPVMRTASTKCRAMVGFGVKCKERVVHSGLCMEHYTHLLMIKKIKQDDYVGMPINYASLTGEKNHGSKSRNERIGNNGSEECSVRGSDGSYEIWIEGNRLD